VIVLTVLKIILIILLGILAVCAVLLSVPVAARVTGDGSLRGSRGTGSPPGARGAPDTPGTQGPPDSPDTPGAQGPSDTPDTPGAQGVRVDFVWLFGAVRIPLRKKSGSSTADEAEPKRGKRRKSVRRGAAAGEEAAGGGAAGEEAAGEEAGGDQGDEADTSGKGSSLALGAADIPRIARVVVTLLRGILGRFVITADGDLYAGLEDPADTGILWGEGYALVQALHRRTGLRVHPVFDGGTLAFTGTAALRVVPITLLFPVLSVALSRDGRAVIRAIRRKR